jgi:hypothetical protein
MKYSPYVNCVPFSGAGGDGTDKAFLPCSFTVVVAYEVWEPIETVSSFSVVVLVLSTGFSYVLALVSV